MYKKDDGAIISGIAEYNQFGNIINANKEDSIEIFLLIPNFLKIKYSMNDLPQVNINDRKENLNIGEPKGIDFITFSKNIYKGKPGG